MVYRVSSSTARGTQRNTVQRKLKINTKKERKGEGEEEEEETLGPGEMTREDWLLERSPVCLPVCLLSLPDRGQTLESG